MNLADPSTRSQLAYGSFISIKHCYLYFATPKAACTKTKSILWKLEGLGRREPWPIGVHDRRQYDGRISLADCDPETVHFILSSSDWLKFCFVRDPYSRLASGYQSKIASGDEEFGRFRERLARYGELSSAGPNNVSFEDFVRYVCGQEDAKRNEHWRTQSRHLFIDHIHYDFIGRVENYVADMGYVLGRLGAPQRLTLDLQERVNSTAARGSLQSFGEELAALVQREYHADFENFGYDPGSYKIKVSCR